MLRVGPEPRRPWRPTPRTLPFRRPSRRVPSHPRPPRSGGPTSGTPVRDAGPGSPETLVTISVTSRTSRFWPARFNARGDDLRPHGPRSVGGPGVDGLRVHPVDVRGRVAGVERTGRRHAFGPEDRRGQLGVERPVGTGGEQVGCGVHIDHRHGGFHSTALPDARERARPDGRVESGRSALPGELGIVLREHSLDRLPVRRPRQREDGAELLDEADEPARREDPHPSSRASAPDLERMRHPPRY